METIVGQLKGLKSSQLKQLKRLYHQRMPSDCIVTPEHAQRMAAISRDIQQPICCYINRR
ncbi:MAG: GTPase HflX, partial [Acaryochloridaceae cyanobacterium RL_2_7]|nr:GTPase HflX [Acaryochloridaceae cyanobacterium RL_2_7]